MSSLFWLSFLGLSQLALAADIPDIDGELTEDEPVVITASGRVRGKIVRLAEGQAVATFLGLPYAEPPVGQLRFQPPIAKEPWSGIFEATHFGAVCPQDKQRPTWDLAVDQDGKRFLKQIMLRQYNQSEDCLTLNIYVARHRLTDEETTRLNVMFYIHGGSYQMSGGRFYPGEGLAWMGDVVVVTVNYRLGPFGFLSTEDKTCPGNAGLLDQLLALKWIHENIGEFGGDPKKVTIFGNSAGGACIGLHMVSPLTKGLFERAIAQSGSAVAKWAIQRSPKQQAVKLARDVGCSRTNTGEEILQCLRGVPTEMISKRSGILNAMFIRFAPVVDNYFLPSDPEVLIQEGRLHSVPFLTGVTKDEVSIWMSIYSNPAAVRLTKNRVKRYLQHLLSENSTTEANLAALVHAVYTEYANRKRNKVGSKGPDLRTLAEIITDVGLKAPTVKMAKLIAKHSEQPVYMYEFDYSSEDDIIISNNSWIGAYHESELQYLLGEPFLGLTNTLRQDEDKQVSNMLIRFWVDFAKYGSPTGNNGTTNFTWHSYRPDKRRYAVIGLNPKLKKGYNHHRMTFWNSFIPLFTEHSMGVSPRPTCPQNELIGVAVALAIVSALCVVLLCVAFYTRRRGAGLVLRGSPTSV